MVLVSVAVLVVLALASGLTRTPVYTAETTMSVGRISGTSASALSGFNDAARGIADTYSRSIGSSDIIEPAAEELDLDPGSVESQVSATPVPESSVISLAAEGSSPDDAILIANTVSDSLVRYSRRVANSEQETEALLRQYKSAVRQLERKQQAAIAAEDDFATAGSQSAARELARAQAARQAAQVRADGLRGRYQSAQEAGGSAALVDVIERANFATDDRQSYLGLVLVIAVVAGLAIGLALALLRANLQARRLLG